MYQGTPQIFAIFENEFWGLSTGWLLIEVTLVYTMTPLENLFFNLEIVELRKPVNTEDVSGREI